MSITQSLSDIQVMLKYVERLLEERGSDQPVEMLSKLGHNTLDIIEHMEKLNTSISSITDNVMTKHAEILTSSSTLTKESLAELIRKIEENEVIQRTVHEEIQTIYTSYNQSVSKVMSYMTNNKSRQEAVVDELGVQITGINDSVSSINDKVLSKNDMSSIMSEISDQLRIIIDADTQIDAQNQTMLQGIKESLSTTQSIVEASSGELQVIKEMYTESTSRLSIIDVKMDAMSKYVMREG